MLNDPKNFPDRIAIRAGRVRLRPISYTDLVRKQRDLDRKLKDLERMERDIRLKSQVNSLISTAIKNSKGFAR